MGPFRQKLKFSKISCEVPNTEKVEYKKYEFNFRLDKTFNNFLSNSVNILIGHFGIAAEEEMVVRGITGFPQRI